MRADKSSCVIADNPKERPGLSLVAINEMMDPELRKDAAFWTSEQRISAAGQMLAWANQLTASAIQLRALENASNKN